MTDAALPLPATVLVTGASGFLGRYVVAGLQGRGVQVRALVRSSSAEVPPGVERCVMAAGLDDPALRDACRGMEAVVHLAARAHIMRDPAPDRLAEFRRVNVEGTRAVMTAALEAGAGRFVHISSAKAVGESSPACWTAETPANPTDPYGVSKRESELVVRALADAAGTHAAILRLPLLYGAGVRANMLSLFRAVDRGMVLPLNGIRNRRSLAFAGNVVAAMEAVLTAPRARAATLFVSDDEDLSTSELVRRIGRALGRPARLLPFPERTLRVAARAGDLVAKALPFPLTTAAVDRLTGSLCMDVSPLKALGWAPRFTVDEGLAETAAWYRRQPA